MIGYLVFFAFMFIYIGYRHSVNTRRREECRERGHLWADVGERGYECENCGITGGWD